MKLTYKHKLSLYFAVIYSVFTVCVVVFEQSREKRYRTATLEEKLDANAEIINASLRKNNHRFEALDTLIGLFPQNIRVSLIDIQGLVIFDNSVEDISQMDNHAGRPEIISASKNGKGTDIRRSETKHTEYLYYARRFDDVYIRVALPYDIHTQRLLKTDKTFLYFMLVLFATTLVLLNYRQLNESKKNIDLEREKLLEHVHSSEEGICFFTANKTVKFFNSLFIQYLNIVADAPENDPSVVFTDNAFYKMNKFLATANEKYFECKIRRQGKKFSLRVNIFEDRSFEVVLNNITKQEKTRLLKQEITGNIAHELRTPVTSIRGYLETVLGQTLNDEQKNHFIARAHHQTIVLSELIQDITLITNIEEAPQMFKMEDINLNNLLETLKNDLLLSLQKKNIDMQWNTPENLTVKGNQNLLYAVFRNLADNVIRYAGENISVRIIKNNEDRDFHYFSFYDTGVGIADESHLNRLFERFYRINEGRTRDTGGSGLGLSIVKNAIALHKGNITVKNRKEGGLEFLFTIGRM